MVKQNYSVNYNFDFGYYNIYCSFEIHLFGEKNYIKILLKPSSTNTQNPTIYTFDYAIFCNKAIYVCRFHF